MSDVSSTAPARRVTPASRVVLAFVAVTTVLIGTFHAVAPEETPRREVLQRAGADRPAPVETPAVEERAATAAPAVTSLPPVKAPAQIAPTTTPPARTAAAAPPATIAYEGLGTWIDAYDFSRELTRTPQPPVRPEMVDAMAASGVKTIYIQAAMRNPKVNTALLSVDLLGQFVTKAHAKGMRVVAWYLPRFEGYEHGYDLAYLRAIHQFQVQGQRFDGIAVDIEWTKSVPDHDLRSAILVGLSQQLRAMVGPGYPLGAITMPPVQTDVINPKFWPGYPYRQLAPLYDVWMTMGYWTDRKHSSGYRHSYNYTVENITRLKMHLGQADAKIHPIGGIGHQSSRLDYAGFVRAALEQGAVGASVYDYATQAPDSWDALKLAPSPHAQSLKK